LFDEWYTTASDEEKLRIISALKKRHFCFNLRKVRHLEMDWKKHISDDPETFKYRESETNMYYETSNIMNYLEDCRVRKASVSDQDILDYEMVHRDVPQKLFFTIPGI